MKHICRNQVFSWRQCQTCLKVAGCAIISVIITYNILGKKDGSLINKLSMNNNQNLELGSWQSVWRKNITGNPLIDKYGSSPVNLAGEYGRGVVMTSNMKDKVDQVMKVHRINTIVSDDIPLNRMVPDSRIQG